MFVLKPAGCSLRRFCSLRSHNRWGGAVSPREDLLESYYLHLSISNLFNRNKSGRCAPWKSKEAYSYESELSTSGPLRVCLIEMPDQEVGHDVCVGMTMSFSDADYSSA